MVKDLDSRKTLEKHRKIIRRKGFLNRIYRDFYERLKHRDIPKGSIVELGSGAGFIKEIIPDAITSDIIKGPGIDKVFSAEKIPCKNSSVSAFVMFDVLHHIKDPEKALKEMQRCLKVGGKIIMIEPFLTLWGKFISKYIHPEYYNPSAGWELKGKGRLSGVNSALPWIIFVRDREIFERKFPKLKIERITPHTPIRYLVSGGLTELQFLPTFSYPLVLFLERLLAPGNKFLGMFAKIVLKKVN